MTHFVYFILMGYPDLLKILRIVEIYSFISIESKCGKGIRDFYKKKKTRTSRVF